MILTSFPYGGQLADNSPEATISCLIDSSPAGAYREIVLMIQESRDEVSLGSGAVWLTLQAG